MRLKPSNEKGSGRKQSVNERMGRRFFFSAVREVNGAKLVLRLQSPHEFFVDYLRGTLLFRGL